MEAVDQENFRWALASLGTVCWNRWNGGKRWKNCAQNCTVDGKVHRWAPFTVLGISTVHRCHRLTVENCTVQCTNTTVQHRWRTL